MGKLFLIVINCTFENLYEIIHLSLCFNGHFSRWTWVPSFIEDEDDGSGGDNCSYKFVQSSSQIVTTHNNKPAPTFL